MPQKKAQKANFSQEAEKIISLSVAHQVNSLGGYGPKGEVIYYGHPIGCPSVLVDKSGPTTATYSSNGSIDLKTLHQKENKEVHVLRGSFDAVEKKEIGPLSSNIWLSIQQTNQVVSLLNPNINKNVTVKDIKIVKRSSDRSMWYCSTLAFDKTKIIQTVLKVQLVETAKGPALLRQLYLKNLGSQNFKAKIWGYFDLRGTQYFVYNKCVWYDAGLPLSNKEHVISASVPYSELLQIKRISNHVTSGITLQDSTCDYQTFIGDTSQLSIFPKAIEQNKLLKTGAQKNLNRFTSPIISAVTGEVSLNKNKSATFTQSLNYITDAKLIADFLKLSGAKEPRDKAISDAFKKASNHLLSKTDDVQKIAQKAIYNDDNQQPCLDFFMDIPQEKVVSEYANSVWTTVEELYENCRAHGAKLADGIELGTRDRGQDMWPKMKEDPAVVRKDLIHALGFMIQIDEKIPTKGPLKLRHKLHGMFPRQYPSSWSNRTQEIYNDNRPYNDSPIWLVDSLNFYIRETGDLSILMEEVGTVKLTTPDIPETSGLLGHKNKFKIYQVVLEIFNCYYRHAKDTPYGMVQILYGDWCDPVDMFGTGKVGDNKTRGQGKGVCTRLSAHVCLSLIQTIDLFLTKNAQKLMKDKAATNNVNSLKVFAKSLKENIIKVAWEDTPSGTKGFIDSIHEFKKNGKKPNYQKGDIGYTLGSFIKSREFDGRQRRVLTTNSWCLALLNTHRDYLSTVKNAQNMSEELLKTVDKHFFDKILGLRLYTIPIPNNADARTYVGRMGIVPSGCAENGEYHHAQIMMHVFRSTLPNQADASWEQFKPMISATRDEGLAGPFETPTTSYNSDPENPHFGKGMYFGLSGSVDWIVNYFQNLAGLKIQLHDSDLPNLVISPNIPTKLKNNLDYQRTVHYSIGKGKYKKIPVYISVKPKKGSEPEYYINKKKVPDLKISNISKLSSIKVEIFL